MSANGIRVIAACFLVTHLAGQQSLDSAYRTTGTAVVAAFETPRAVLQSSSAVMLDGRKEVGYGVVISTTGHILVKASEFNDWKHPTVTVDRTNFPEPKLMAIDAEWDLALIKVEAVGLVPVVYAPNSSVPQGTWVAVNGATTRSNRRLLAGIVSAKVHEVPALGGTALGIRLNAKSKALAIEEVTDRSGAQAAGLQKGDVILSIAGQAVQRMDDISELLKDHKAGTQVKVTYRRGREVITTDVRLAVRSEMFTHPMNPNDQMSGDFSKRRSGFPRVLQHDILGNGKIVGGPLLDLDGRCLGMNIARANRAESFAIPVEDLKTLAEHLMKQAVQK